MNFTIENKPPTSDMINNEKECIIDEISHIKKRDLLITAILIIASSILLGNIVYWSTDSYQYAGIAMAIFPVLGVIMSTIGITKSAGFRSAAIRMGELRNELIGFNSVSDDGNEDIQKLCKRHSLINNYHKAVEDSGRKLVNGELAMYWEFDTSTMAKTAKGRDYLKQAKESVSD